MVIEHHLGIFETREIEQTLLVKRGGLVVIVFKPAVAKTGRTQLFVIAGNNHLFRSGYGRNALFDIDLRRFVENEQLEQSGLERQKFGNGLGSHKPYANTFEKFKAEFFYKSCHAPAVLAFDDTQHFGAALGLCDVFVISASQSGFEPFARKTLLLVDQTAYLFYGYVEPVERGERIAVGALEFGNIIQRAEIEHPAVDFLKRRVGGERKIVYRSEPGFFLSAESAGYRRESIVTLVRFDTVVKFGRLFDERSHESAAVAGKILLGEGGERLVNFFFAEQPFYRIERGHFDVFFNDAAGNLSAYRNLIRRNDRAAVLGPHRRVFRRYLIRIDGDRRLLPGLLRAAPCQ